MGVRQLPKTTTATCAGQELWLWPGHTVLFDLTARASPKEKKEEEERPTLMAKWEGEKVRASTLSTLSTAATSPCSRIRYPRPSGKCDAKCKKKEKKERK